MKRRAGLRWITLAAGVAIALAATAGREASAGPVTYSFNEANASLPSAPDYGTVTISDNGTNTVSFTLAAPAEPVGAPKWGYDQFGFNYKNLSASDFSVSGPSGWTESTNTSMDGYGKFSIAESNNGSPLLAPVITLTFSSSTAFDAAIANNYADLTVLTSAPPGANFAYFAAHLIENVSDSNKNSAFVAVGPSSPTPEPSTMVLAAVGGVVGLGARLRGRRRLA